MYVEQTNYIGIFILGQCIGLCCMMDCSAVVQFSLGRLATTMLGFHTASLSNVSQDLITAKVDSATHELDDCPISPNWSAHFGFPTGILNQLTLYHEIAFKLCLLLQRNTFFL